MIPLLNDVDLASPLIQTYLTALKNQGFTGDITAHYADRVTMATDNSVYQILPDALLFPRSIADIVLITQTASQAEFKKIVFTPRGGGTGTNGQSLNSGVVIDLSRYMNHILEINVEERWVRVQAGVVKDALNQYLKPYGFFFSPELSTSNRATIGGMINTDASGQGSLVYGKTSDHVLGMRSVLLTGDILDTKAVPIEVAKSLADDSSTVGKIYQAAIDSTLNNRQLILDKFPPLNRFLTGYDLKNCWNDTLDKFDLGRLITGSEGSLAIVAEAKLNITPIPKVRRLININYNSFDAALRAAPLMLEAKALSVETVDSKVLNLAREDIIWASVKHLITPETFLDAQSSSAEKLIQGINIVEFAGDDESLINAQVANLKQKLDQQINEQNSDDEARKINQSTLLGYQICENVDEIERVYAMRKKAVGLLGNTKGAAKPIAFVEDTCVPPQHLADYILEFRALLDSYNLTYGMFGHVDAGVLHVRPALDLCDPVQEDLLHTLSDKVVELTAKYGGLLWGEHGKGFRAQYSPEFFGEQLYQELRKVKSTFDPHNRLNPGKICTPLPENKDAQLMQITAVKRATFDRQIPVVVREAFRGAMECNGNGLCFNFDKNSVMCPSMKLTSNRLHSPKGRAALVREWLRLLTQQGVDPNALLDDSAKSSLSSTFTTFKELIQRTRNTLQPNSKQYDFSSEVKTAMDGCLACKACSTQCPIKIDVPHFRSQFLALYHTRYLRPIADHLLCNIEKVTPLLAKAPKVFNFFMRQPLVNSLSKNLLGMQDLPLLSSPSLRDRLKSHPTANLSVTQIEQLTAQERENYVLIVQDPFTSFYEAELLTSLVKLIEDLGFHPVLLPFHPNGKAQHVKGFLKQFNRTAHNTAKFLTRIAALNIPMIGVDAALVLCYRDEYLHVLKDTNKSFRVQLVDEWLLPLLEHLQKDNRLPTFNLSSKALENKPSNDNNVKQAKTWHLFSHCTESTQSPQSQAAWQKIFAFFEQKLECVNVGCCGMAGTYGHETKHAEDSKQLFNLSWKAQLDKRDKYHCLATGYSCRSQVKRFDDNQLAHPLQIIEQLLQNKQ